MSLDPPVDPAVDHVKGPADAPLTLVEYGDFECPYCGDAYPSLQEVCRRLGKRMRFVYRHFPIAEKHPHAELAAEAAEAAGAQGKFWEMHNVLFESQRHLDAEALRSYAEELGLGLERFDADLASHRFLDKVRADRASGERSGVTGTPGLFINGERYTGFYEEEALTDALTMR